jgi:glucokinase
MEARARKLHEEGRETDLFKIMRKHDHDRLTSGIWERALNAKDELTIELIDEAVEALGAGIASVVNLLDVEAVIIGGGIGVRLGEPYAKKITKQMHKHLFNDDRPPAVEVAALGDLGGAIGAALLSAERDGKPARAATATAQR